MDGSDKEVLNHLAAEGHEADGCGGRPGKSENRCNSPSHPVLSARLSSAAHYIPRMYDAPARLKLCTHNPFQYVNLSKHNPTVSVNMYNPTTVRAETIESLLSGPDTATWKTSLTN